MESAPTEVTMSNTPRLRFGEFDGEWSEKRLGDITSYVDYRGRAPIKVEKGIFLVTAKNIKKGYIDYDTSKEYVDIDNYDNVMSKGKPKLGDILFTTEAPLGNICQVDNINIALAQRVIKLRGNQNLSNNYLLHYMLSPNYQKLINRMAFGTTVLGISGKALKQTAVLYPTLPEQQKIATFLSAIDSSIEQLSKKEQLLRTYKKGVMQKIFSREIRFKRDDGGVFEDWVEKRLGDIGDFKSGTGFPEKEQGGKVGIPFYKVSDMNLRENKITMNIANNYVTTEQINHLKLKPIESNAIIFAKVGAAIFLERKRKAKNFLIDNNMMAFIPTCNIEFIVQYFYTIRLSKYAQVGALPSYNASDLKGIKINLPSLPEQTKIANFLSSLDKQIAQVSEQLAEKKDFKKGLLQKMFV